MFIKNIHGEQLTITGFAVSAVIFCASSAGAQTLPGSADPGRINPLQVPMVPQEAPAPLLIPEVLPEIAIPDTAKQVHFRLQGVHLRGSTAFPESVLAKIYTPYMDKEVTLEIIWLIAGQITQHYQHQGYFLSRTYVPAQEIEDGRVTLTVVEGYIADVVLEDVIVERPLVQNLIARITAQKPLSAAALESFMLQLNALPGVEFRAFVEPLENAEPGAVRLTLSPQDEVALGTVSFDNFGSRFLGPYQATATYQDSFLPLQRTTFSALSSLPPDELKYAALRHQIPLAPDWEAQLYGNYVTAAPGASLEPNRIQSDSVEMGLGISYQAIRQRQKNLLFSLDLSGKNTNGDILDNNPLTRDRIRVGRAKLSYDTADSWNGYNYLSLALNQGLAMLDSSRKGDLNLSRAEAEPDFTSISATYTRQQGIYGKWLVVGKTSGQLASAPLFSGEEFGYGGQGFGRAYDPSEITGDHGIAAALELRYLGLESWREAQITPYAFYDIGKIWNEDRGSVPESAASAGLGARVSHTSGISGNLGLAWPLTRDAGTPLYGDDKSPRLLLQLDYGF